MQVGIALDLALGRFFSLWTSENLRDAKMLVGAVAILLVASTLSSIVPVRRAVAIEPMKALRAE